MNIIEVQGIKCSARSFQIELEMKQSLILRPEEFKLFDKCVIQTKPQSSSMSQIEPENGLDTKRTTESVTISTDDNVTNNIVSGLINDISTEIEQSGIEQSGIDNDINNLGKSTNTENNGIDINTEANEPEVSNDNNTKIDNSNNLMEEVEFTLEELPTDDKLILKNPNEVYYQMYRDARQKAKVAKELALSSYLEAKNIKNTYMLNDIDSDTSDLEIDDESINSENDYK